MITVTDRYGYPTYINPTHITRIEQVNDPSGKRHRIHLVDGKDFITFMDINVLLTLIPGGVQ